ncbi:hypothetical protein GE107_16060 [Cohnella sp. CFH 77786]|uniref:hypothetical protein n=1 Tax=Cohnella sp. CFH 77786 TaxID=2662265 RepID=UPI001C60CC36|nr:hypothetical protein [Cohnella sp. CFH 77786]MBW5447572.1 hypothetical protein [Cohnella sp. CFH 77786]
MRIAQTICNYDFSDLKAGYPLRGSRVPHCLYIYPAMYEKLIAFQFPGEEIIERTCSPKEYREYWTKEQELRFRGWQIGCYDKEHLEAELSVLTHHLEKIIELACRRDRKDI